MDAPWFNGSDDRDGLGRNRHDDEYRRPAPRCRCGERATGSIAGVGAFCESCQRTELRRQMASVQRKEGAA